MAYSARQSNTEHPSKTIVKMVQAAKASGVWPKVMLIYGKEDFLVSWAKNYIRAQIVNPATEALDCSVFSEDNYDPYEVIAACETLPMMSERKLVIVDGCDENAGPISDYLPQVPETTLLLLVRDKANKTKSLYKSANKTGIVYDFCPLDDATLSGWLAKRFKAAGKAARPEDLLNFAKNCGYGDPDKTYNLNNLENDLKKVFAATDKQVLSLDEMMEYSSAQSDINAFKLLDAAFSGNKSEALTILHNTIDIQSASNEMGALMSFLGLLCSQLEIMLEGRERQESGQGYYDVVKAMNINEYRFKKAMQSCSKQSIRQLRKSLDSAFQIEKDIKTGAMDAYLALELFIAKL